MSESSHSSDENISQELLMTSNNRRVLQNKETNLQTVSSKILIQPFTPYS